MAHDPSEPSSWGRELRAARLRADQSPDAALMELRGRGATLTSPSTLSNWEHGKTQRLDETSQRAVASYIQDHAPTDADLAQAAELLSRRRRRRSGSSPTPAVLAAEPLGLDHLLLTATLRRIETGPPLSDADERTISHLTDLLRARPGRSSNPLT